MLLEIFKVFQIFFLNPSFNHKRVVENYWQFKKQVLDQKTCLIIYQVHTHNSIFLMSYLFFS